MYRIPPESEIEGGVKALRAGGLVAFPTETVYGLGADATNAAAVRRIFAAKRRPATNPLIVHAANVGVARQCVADWPEVAQRLAERFWPGPLTLVLPRGERIAAEVTAGGPTVAVRVPDHPVALELLRRFGGPVAAPSANRSERISPTTARHVRDDLGGEVDVVLDGGPCLVGIESTVLSLVGPVATVLRPGGLSVEMLREVLGRVEVRGGSDEGIAASPGRAERHYSPRVWCGRFEAGLPDPVLADAARGGVVAVLALEPGTLRRLESQAGATVRVTAMPREPREYAAQLYARLREAESARPRAIWVEMPPPEAPWLAIRDRLMRASEG